MRHTSVVISNAFLLIKIVLHMTQAYLHLWVVYSLFRFRTEPMGAWRSGWNLMEIQLRLNHSDKLDVQLKNRIHQFKGETESLQNLVKKFSNANKFTRQPQLDLYLSIRSTNDEINDQFKSIDDPRTVTEMVKKVRAILRRFQNQVDRLQVSLWLLLFTV